MSGADRRLRFFSSAPVSRSLIHGLTHYDPNVAIAFAAVDRSDGALCGVGRLHRMPGREGEFAVLIRSDLKGRGLGRRLLTSVVAAAPGLGVDVVVGLVLPDNACMLTLAREFGFEIDGDPNDPSLVRVRLDLASAYARAEAA